MIGYIYEIVSNDPEKSDRYIGSTTQYKQRLLLHKSRSNNTNGKWDNTLYTIIRKNGGWNNFSMNKLEEYIFDNIIMLRERERLYYEVYDPNLNDRYPYVRPDQYNAHRYNIARESYLIRRKSYYSKNRDLILQKAKEYGSKEDVKLKKSEYNKQYALANKEKIKARKNARKILSLDDKKE